MDANRQDQLIFGGGLIVCLVAVAVWLAFPVYQLQGGGYAHRPVWAPPQLPIRHGYDDLSEADIARLSQIPGQREILENMRTMPRSYSSHPFWIGNRYGPPKNALFLLAVLTIAGYVALLRHRGII